MILIESPAVAMGAVILRVNSSPMASRPRPITEPTARLVGVRCVRNSLTSGWFVVVVVVIFRCLKPS